MKPYCGGLHGRSEQDRFEEAQLKAQLDDEKYREDGFDEDSICDLQTVLFKEEWEKWHHEV